MEVTMRVNQLLDVCEAITGLKANGLIDLDDSVEVRHNRLIINCASVSKRSVVVHYSNADASIFEKCEYIVSLQNLRDASIPEGEMKGSGAGEA